MPILRLLTYNVRSLRDDRAAVARVISSVDPHVVCLQEAPRLFRWRQLNAQLARASSMVVVGGEHPVGGNLILSSLAVEVESTADVAFTKDRRLHQRGTAIAVLSLGGARFAVAGTHLDVVAEPRLRHVGELLRAIEDNVPHTVGTIIAGDINDIPGSPSWTALSEPRRDAFAAVGAGDGYSSTATNPHQRIDGVFVDESILIRSARVLDQDDVKIASDHRPVLVELELT